MSVKFRLVERKNLGADNQATPKKVYAQVVYGDLIPFETFLDEVSDGSGVGSAQVKAVMDRVSIVLSRHLSLGQRVSVGELGTFRYGVGSKGVAKEDDFSTDLIKRPRVIFSPGPVIRNGKISTTYEKKEPSMVECDKPHVV